MSGNWISIFSNNDIDLDHRHLGSDSKLPLDISYPHTKVGVNRSKQTQVIEQNWITFFSNSDLVFDPRWPIFELIRVITDTYILTKFRYNWTDDARRTFIDPNSSPWASSGELKIAKHDKHQNIAGSVWLFVFLSSNWNEYYSSHRLAPGLAQLNICTYIFIVLNSSPENNNKLTPFLLFWENGKQTIKVNYFGCGWSICKNKKNKTGCTWLSIDHVH
jgi:hypothetical protein